MLIMYQEILLMLNVSPDLWKNKHIHLHICLYMFVFMPILNKDKMNKTNKYRKT